MADDTDRLYEQVLIARCRTDDSAFAELIGRYQRRLAFFVRKMLPASAGIDDVLQDIWFDVYRGLKRLKDPSAFPAWFYTIARRRVIRNWNGQASHWESPLTADIEETEALPEFMPEDAGRIQAALDRLSPAHREVLVLRFLDELSYDDIARITGTELGTVRSRLYYARKHLRQILERERNDE